MPRWSRRPRNAVAGLLCAALLSGCAHRAAEPLRVQLIAFNDFHGNLEPPPGSVTIADAARPAGTRISAGGIAYLASLIRELKAEEPNTLVVGAGDMVGASPFTSAVFNDEPTIDALGAAGLEITSVGNHEFDRGRDELLRLQHGGCLAPSDGGRRGRIGVDTCMNDGRFAGARFQYLAANVIDEATGRTLLPAYALREVGGVKIGFIGVTLQDTPSVVDPAGVRGLRFAPEAATVNALVPELQRQGAAVIVVLIHQGGATTATHVDDRSCPGFGGAIAAIADAFVPAVDIVVSGHTHREYVCTRADGKLLTQAGFYGRSVTRIALSIDPRTHRLLGKSAETRVVANGLPLQGASVDGEGDDAAPRTGTAPLPKDAALDALVQRYASLSAGLKHRPSGRITASIDRTRDRAGESALGDLVADAYLAATANDEFGRPVAAFVNSGGLRQDLLYDASRQGDIDYGQLYAVLPFGNNLVSMDLSGDQLRRVLEQQWESPQPEGGRMLQVSSGFRYAWDASRPASAAPGEGRRIVPGSLTIDGVAVVPDRSYRVTVNSFLASGGDHFTVLTEGRARQDGPFEMDLFDAYFRTRSPISTSPRGRIERRD